MKNQDLFPLKDKSEKLKCRLLQLGFLRVNEIWKTVIVKTKHDPVTLRTCWPGIL